MSVETFTDFYEKWVKVIPDNIECNVIWHGGEPTLRGINFFEKVLSQSKKLTPHTKIVKHCLQTNGLSIDERWANMLSKHSVMVGVSIDGPKDLHDQFRVLHNGQGTFDKALHAYKLLAAKQVAAGIVVVVNKQNARRPDTIFRFLKENGIKRLQLSPCFEHDDPNDNYSVTNDDFADFVCRLYDLWVTEDDPEVSIGIISDVVDYLLGKTHHNCMLSDNCHNFLLLNWDGEIKTCDGMRSRQKSMGFVRIEEVGDYSFSKKWIDEHHLISKARLDTCGSCEWFGMCGGGCPYHWPDNGPTKTKLCLSHRKIFRHIATSLKSIYGGL